MLRDVEDLGKAFGQLPDGPVYRFVPSAFVAYNTHGCPLKLRLDYPADRTQQQQEEVRHSTAARNKERGIYMEAALVDSLGSKAIRCDSAENVDRPITSYMTEFSNDLRGPQEVLLCQLKVEMPLELIERFMNCVPEEIREATRSRVVFRPMFPDVIRLRKVLNEKTNRSEVEVTAIDIKSSSHMKGGHQMQVALYHHVLEALLTQGNEQGWHARMNTKGEVWIPKRLPSGKVDYEKDVFNIDTLGSFIETFFGTVVPRIVAYDPRSATAKYEDIEWTLNDSCVMCSHLQDCKGRALNQGLVQILPGINRRDWQWLPKSIHDVQTKAQSNEMSHRLVALTRAGLVPAAFRQQAPIPNVQQGTATYRLPARCDAWAVVALAVDPFDGSFVYGCSLDVFKNGMTTFFNASDAQTFCDHLAKSMKARNGQVFRLVVWNEPQRRALVRFCRETNNWLPLEDDFATLDPNPTAQTSEDGIRPINSNMVKLCEVAKQMAVLPVAGQPTLRETFLFLADPSMAQGGDDAYGLNRVVGFITSRAPFNVEDQQAIDDYFMEKSPAEREQNAPLILYGMLSVLRNLRDGCPAECFKGHETPLDMTNLPKDLRPTKPITDSGVMLDVLHRAMVFDACAALDEKTLARQRKYLVQYCPDPRGGDASDPATMTIRLLLHNRDDASDFGAQSRAESEPLRCTGCKGKDSSFVELKIANCRNRTVEGTKVDTFSASEGSFYFLCPACNNQAFKKPNEWLPVDFHPVFGNRFLSLGSWCLQKLDSPLEIDDAKWYKKLQMHIKPPSGSATMFCDVTDVNTTDGTVYIARRNNGVILQPNTTYMLSQRYVNFNVGKAVSALRVARTMAGQTPLVQMSLGQRWSKDDMITMQYDSRLDDHLSTPARRFYDHTLREPLTVLWGPPGTGKTQTLTQAILSWTRAAPNVRILVVAMTHKAVGELASRRSKIIEKPPFSAVPPTVRFSHIKEGGETIIAQGLGKEEEFGAFDDDEAGSPKSSKDTKLPPVVPTDGSGCVVYCTIWEAWKRWLKTSKGSQPIFDILIVDEASQMPFAYSLVPSLLMRPNCRVVLSGDLLQLPPIFNHFDSATSYEKPYVASTIQALMRRRPEDGSAVGEPVENAFDILEGTWADVCPLTISYRSAPPIVDFVATLYPAGLGANFQQKYSLHAEYEELTPPVNAADRTMLESPLCTVGGVHANEEAEVIVNIILLLNDAYVPEPGSKPENRKTVMVVTPHRRQRDDIKRALRKRMEGKTSNFKEVTIDTAEKMQGSEASFVLFALAAVSSASSFIFDVFRLNVAFSRAQQQVILVASDQTLSPPSSVLDSYEGRMAFSHLKRFVDRSVKVPGAGRARR